MPKIPVNVDQFPDEVEPLDENIPYNVIVRDCRLSEKEDTNGDLYLTGVKLEIMEPAEWKGRSIYANYICIPSPVDSGADLGTRRSREERGVALKRFIKGFKIPYDAEGLDPRDAIGCEGVVTVRNEEYNGRKIPRVNEFLL